MEAGLINNFVVSVSSRRLCVSGENGDVTEELEWDLENYKAKQEVSADVCLSKKFYTNYKVWILS